MTITKEEIKTFSEVGCTKTDDPKFLNMVFYTDREPCRRCGLSKTCKARIKMFGPDLKLLKKKYRVRK